MRVAFLGKHKRSAANALRYLASRGCEVVAVVAPPPAYFTGDEQRIDLVAEEFGMPLLAPEELDSGLEDLGEIDVVLSFLYWKRIRGRLLEIGRRGCINFHPAPLPDFRGLGGYNVAIWEGLTEWGVSAHYVDAEFDTGDLIIVDRFPIEENETALSLDMRSQRVLEDVFCRVIDLLLSGDELPRERQGRGRYVSREDFENLRVVQPTDTPGEIARRIRAFWYPPHDGAVMDVNGVRLTLVDRTRLEDLAMVYRDAGHQS